MTTTTQDHTGREGRMFAGVQLREVETTESYSMIKGLAVPYDEFTNIGWFLEAFAPKSLGKSIREAGRDLPLNIFHESHMFPIGAASEWTEKATGLEGVWRIDTEAEIAQNAARLANEGMLTGLSIEFVPIRSEWEEPKVWDPSAGPEFMDRVTRVEARLVATGLVQAPAYVSAGVALVRSADARRVIEQQRSERSGTPVLDAMRARTEQLRAGTS